MLNSFIWLILALLMILPSLVSGHVGLDTGIVLGIGLLFSLISEGLRRKTTWQHKFNLVIAVLWGAIYFAIGFPNLKVPGVGIRTGSLVALIAFAILPLLLVLIVKKFTSRKMNSSIQNP